ncbi:MAG: hypothetical protein GXY03_12890 [Solirubrobacterales bacterium]|nr:hypothetical protein [Solirubrobacterales bacterium]
MSPIRPLVPDDLAAVAAIYADFDGRSRSEVPRLVEYFERAVLADPAADPEIPSLVYEDRGDGVVGAIFSHVRRFTDGERPVRIAFSGPLLARPDHRRRGVGALLLRRYLAGAQDVTATDGAVDEVQAMWQGLGGSTHAAASVGWGRVLAPAGFVAGGLARKLGERNGPAPGAPLLAKVDARASGRLLPAAPPGSVSELTPHALIDLLPRLKRQLSLRPAYDERYLDWLFSELAVARVPGDPVRRMVFDGDGRPAGSYVMFVAPGGIAQVVQVAAVGDDVAMTFDHMVRDAAARGAVEIRGRVETHLLAHLRRMRCRMIPTEWTLVHSDDPALLATILSGRALFTRLDGEWWMQPHTRRPVASAGQSARG